jgi:hypothetical protein
VQSLRHRIGEVFAFANVPKIFEFVRGGGLDVGFVAMNGDNQTLLTIGEGYDGNYNSFTFHNVSIDGSTDAPVLINIDDSEPRDPVCVSITGVIQAGATYTAADLVQGEQPDDRIFINFMSENGSVVEDFNSQSKVDASGRFILSGEFDAP